MNLTTTNKFLIGALILTIVGCITFIMYKEYEISQRQKAIEETIIAQKQLTDNLIRSMSQYATSDQIKQYLNDNKVDVSAIEKDIATLHAKIDSVNTFITDSLGYDWHDLPSTDKQPGGNPKPPEKVVCEGQQIDCFKDPNHYLSTQQSLILNEKFKNLDVPFGKVTFDGSKDAPWSVAVSNREYKVLTIQATDENNRIIDYNKFIVTVDGKEYSMPIISAATQQVYPDPVFRWWSPRLYLGFDVGFNFAQIEMEYGPNINLAIMNYGKYVQTPDFSILQLGLGAGLKTHQAYFTVTPFAYNVGKHFPFIMNTYLGPSMQVSTHGDVAAMIGLRLGL